MQKNIPTRSNGVSESMFLVTLLFLFISSFPFGALANEKDLAKGKALFEKHCAVCHGLGGKGDGYTLLDPPPADLTSKAIQKKSYKELWQEVHDGIPDTAMGMWKVALSNEEITLVLAYVRTLGQ